MHDVGERQMKNLAEFETNCYFKTRFQFELKSNIIYQISFCYSYLDLYGLFDNWRGVCFKELMMLMGMKKGSKQLRHSTFT